MTSDPRRSGSVSSLMTGCCHQGAHAPRSFWVINLVAAISLIPIAYPCSAADSDKSQFVLHKTDGTDATGLLDELASNWSLRLRGDQTTRADVDAWVALRRPNVPLPSLSFQGEQLHFANGDRIAAKVLETAGGRLGFHFGPVQTKPLQVALSALSLIWLKSPENVEDLEGWRWKRATEKRSRDKVWLANGDEVEGIIKGLNADKVLIEVNRKVLDIPRDKVAVIGLSTELAALLRPKTTFGRAIMSNGTRLSFSKAVCSDRITVSGTTLFGEPVTLPLAEILALYLYQARAVYLSDLKPLDYEFTSYLSTSPWPYVKDGCVLNHELHLDGGTFDKGLGMHSRSRLSYDLGGNYRRFEALVGLDEKSGREGTAQIKVLVDGKPRDLGTKGELFGMGKPLFVGMDVSGAKILTLLADFGKRGSVQSNVDWAEARLIK